MSYKMKCFLVISVIGTALAPVFYASPASAAVSNWQNGVSIVPRSNTDFDSASFRQSVDNVAGTKANYLTLIIPLYQSNVYSTDIGTGWNTPTDAALTSAITYARGKGLKVNLKIHLDSYDGQWRANINPGDRNTWFNNYGNMVLKYAAIAKAQGAEEMTIGAEMINMTANDANGTNTANWQTLIGKIRAAYSGKLTYSANWGGPGWTDEKNRITFWGSLDYIGVAAYFPLPAGDASVASLKSQWSSIDTGDLAPLSNRYGKPIIFTEIGYRSIDWARWQPFAFWGGGNYDPTQQANLYDALFSYWNDKSYMQGAQWWDWSSDPNAGGQGNQDYTPQNKPAQQIMTNWFGSAAPPSPGPTPPPASAPYTASAGANPASANTGQSVAITATVNQSGSSSSAANIDLEIYNTSGTRVFQKIFENEAFAAGQSKTYSAGWTPATAGTYSVKVGVFNAGWTSLLVWNDNAATIIVSAGVAPPPMGSNISIWWPTSGITISGVQPFKAALDGTALSAYDMFWQVDAGVLVAMADNTTNAPHKEALVDVSGWNWKNAGLYTINFVAKDKSGNVVAQKSINISVAH